MQHKNNVLRDFLDQYPISIAKCRKLSGVHRTTFNRWLTGETNPPKATLELFRLHATGEPPSTDKEWQGWCFTQGKLFTPANRGYSPHEILMFPMLYRSHSELQAIRHNFTLQARLF